MPLPGYTKEVCGVSLYGDLGTLDSLVTSAPEVSGRKRGQEGWMDGKSRGQLSD
jgi:hypothetical protein